MAKRKKRKGRSAAFMRSINPFLKRSRSKKRGVRNMPKRRKHRSKRSFMRSSARPAAVLLGGGIYGAVRAKLSNALSPITSKIPLGNIGDEVGLFALHYFVNKKIRNKLVKDVTFAGMAVEAARIGETVISGSFLSGMSGGTSGSSMPTLG